jgi:hypothetical protein
MTVIVGRVLSWRNGSHFMRLRQALMPIFLIVAAWGRHRRSPPKSFTSIKTFPRSSVVAQRGE